MKRHDTVIIGGGQAGLAMSHHLTQRGRDHLILERDRLGGRWHDERWDSLHYQFPNWSLRLPGHRYQGDDPEGFSHYSVVVAFLEEYARKIAPNARLGVDVTRVRRSDGGFKLTTSEGELETRNLVIACGAFPHPFVPSYAGKISTSIEQLHSAAYRSPDHLPKGPVLVVGSGSSGGQIAEELHLSGRQVFLSVSRHRKVPRRFLGKDMLWWFFELGYMDRTIDSMPDCRPPPAILLSGIDGGHDLDIRQFGTDGVTLLGRTVGADGNQIQLADNLHDLLDAADDCCREFLTAATDHARKSGMEVGAEDVPVPLSGETSPGTCLDLKSSGIESIIWCTGYRPAFDWIEIPVFDSLGAPIQQRGVTSCPALYFLGLHWMHSFKSGALFGVGDDAEFIADLIAR